MIIERSYLNPVIQSWTNLMKPQWLNHERLNQEWLNSELLNPEQLNSWTLEKFGKYFILMTVSKSL